MKLSWNDITVGKFQRIAAIEAKGDTEDTPYELVGVIHNMTLEQVLDLPLNQTTEMVAELEGLKKEPKNRLVKSSYTINGKKYKCMLNMDDMTTAQYIDFKQMAENYQEHLPQLLSIFLIPDKCTYNKGYNIEFVQKEISDYLSIEDGLAIANFFSIKCELLMRLALHSSKKMLKKASKTGNKELMEKAEETRRMINQLEKEIHFTYTSR